jgi:Flp pilus assembly protein TadG
MRARTRFSGERGAAAVEFAIVSGVFIMILWGILQFGYIFDFKHNLALAASEGARAAVAKALPADQKQTAIDTAKQRLQSIGTSASWATVDATDPYGCDATDPNVKCIKVTITYPWREHPLIPPLLTVAVPETLHAESVVEVD